MDRGKFFWGILLGFVYLAGIISFVRSVKRSQGVVYNWFSVVASFLTVGLVLYVIFIVQP
jgi:hypothetical protein